MSELLDMLRAIVRDELARLRPPELAVVTDVFPGDGGDGNHQVGVRLRTSGAELTHVPVTVPRMGFSLLPREGDLVVVVFVEGDINSPIVVGSLYDSNNRPPQADPLDALFAPPDEQKDGIRRFHIATPAGGTLTIDDAGLAYAGGGTELKVSHDGDMTVTSAGSVTIEAQSGLELRAASTVLVEAQAGLTLKGATVTLEGQGQVEIKAPVVNLAGTTMFRAS